VPLYEYSCPQCGRFELIRKFSDPPVAVCPTCGKAVQKLLSAPAIQFKGTGWYVTDYSKKSSGGESSAKAEAAAAAAPAASSAGEASKDSAPKESNKAPAKSAKKE
jgi:putative FmdB family regulatory protein